MKTHTIPEGILFADEASEENFRKAMEGEVNEHGIRPMIVITADRPGAGKTTLARHILEHHGKGLSPCRIPVREEEWEKLLPAAIGQGYLFLDNQYGRLDSGTLAAFLTSKSWSWRKLGTHEMVERDVDVLVVVTSNCLLEMSEDMLRRVRLIELTVGERSPE